jgi:hypothetical protein
MGPSNISLGLKYSIEELLTSRVVLLTLLGFFTSGVTCSSMIEVVSVSASERAFSKERVSDIFYIASVPTSMITLF